MDRPRTAVIVPALDEAETITALLAAVPSWAEVVVVDNGCTDGTAALARAAGATVLVEPRKGYGRAVQAGLAHLRLDPPGIVVILDADLSDDPAHLGLLVDPIARDLADFVLTDRTRDHERGALTLPQVVGNWIARVGIERATGHAYRDLGPFRALRWSSLEALGLSDPTWGWNVEMQLAAARASLRIQEIPLRYRNRRGGRSKISGTVIGTVRAGYRILAILARHGAL